MRLGIAAALLLAGCFDVPRPAPDLPDANAALARRVAAALKDCPDDAAAYAGLYAVLADRFEKRAYATTAEAAAVAGRAADILEVPGVLKRIAGEQLDPLLGKPQAVTPEIAARAAAKLRSLSKACAEAAR